MQEKYCDCIQHQTVIVPSRTLQGKQYNEKNIVWGERLAADKRILCTHSAIKSNGVQELKSASGIEALLAGVSKVTLATKKKKKKITIIKTHCTPKSSIVC